MLVKGIHHEKSPQQVKAEMITRQSPEGHLLGHCALLAVLAVCGVISCLY